MQDHPILAGASALSHLHSLQTVARCLPKSSHSLHSLHFSCAWILLIHMHLVLTNRQSCILSYIYKSADA